MTEGKKKEGNRRGKKKPCIAGQSRYQLLSQVKPAVFTYFWCRRVTRTVLGTNFLRTSQSHACFPVNRSNDDHIHGSINHRCPSKTTPTYLSVLRSSVGEERSRRHVSKSVAGTINNWPLECCRCRAIAGRGGRRTAGKVTGRRERACHSSSQAPERCRIRMRFTSHA